MKRTFATRASLATLAAAGLALGSSGQALAAGEWVGEELPQQEHQSALTTAASGGGATWAFGYTFHGQPPHHNIAFQRTDEGWKPTPIPDTGSSPTDSAVASADDAWVASSKPLHWDGQEWKEVPLGETPPEWGEPTITGTAAFGPDDAWVVGSQGNDGPYDRHGAVQHWDGKALTDVPVPEQSEMAVNFNGVGGTSAEDLWVVGDAAENPKAGPFRGIAMHWDGNEWTRAELPGEVTGLQDVEALAPDDVWATGAGNGKAVKLHWDGEAWTKVNEGPGNAGEHRLVRQGDALWEFGYHSVQRYNGNEWQPMPVPDGAALNDGAALPDGGIVGVGKIGETDSRPGAWTYQE